MGGNILKKTRNLLSALLLLGQVIGYAPAVWADEVQSNISTEQSNVDNTKNSMNDSTSTNKEEITTDSSVEQSNQKPDESTDQITESSTKNSQITESESQITNSTATSSSQLENSHPEETRHSEVKKSEKSMNKQSESVSSGVDQASIDEKKKSFYQTPIEPTDNFYFSRKQNSEVNVHFEKDESVISFIRKIGEPARKVGQENDLYASVMIAQAILESANGQSELAKAPNYNLFGIKGTHNGKCVSFTTKEASGDGTIYSVQATFKQYDNYEDSLNDYAQLLKEGLTGNSHFYDGAWKTNAKIYQNATKFLTGRYATDTNYDKKLNELIEIYDLTTYDEEVSGSQLSKEGYIVPVKNYTISSLFGFREREFHRGLDLAAAQGEPIYSSQAGMVSKAEFHPSWGNYVAIEQEDGTTALYAHQQEYQVKVGDKVEQGQIIGYVGSTGNSTGSHLHFELCLDNSLSQSKLIDPKTVLFE